MPQSNKQSSLVTSLYQRLANKPSNFIIAKAGIENIYKRGLETEMAAYPKTASPDKITNIIRDKMIEDSLILQSGEKEKIVSLNSAVFNSINIDYGERMKTVEKVKSAFKGKSDSISGRILALWFYAGPKMSPTMYNQAKELAREKMTKIHNDVKSGKMSFNKAAEIIKDDRSWAKYDPSYKNNAYITFSVQPGEKISFDPDFDQVFRKLKTGEVSALYLIKDLNPETQEKIDAVYMFGQVTHAPTLTDGATFESWLKTQRKTYEIIYF